MNYRNLTCIDANDPLTKLGAKVEVRAVTRAELERSKREASMLSFEKVDHGAQGRVVRANGTITIEIADKSKTAILDFLRGEIRKMPSAFSVSAFELSKEVPKADESQPFSPDAWTEEVQSLARAAHRGGIPPRRLRAVLAERAFNRISDVAHCGSADDRQEVMAGFRQLAAEVGHKLP